MICIYLKNFMMTIFIDFCKRSLVFHETRTSWNINLRRKKLFILQLTTGHCSINTSCLRIQGETIKQRMNTRVFGKISFFKWNLFCWIFERCHHCCCRKNSRRFLLYLNNLMHTFYKRTTFYFTGLLTLITEVLIILFNGHVSNILWSVLQLRAVPTCAANINKLNLLVVACPEKRNFKYASSS